MGTFTTNKPTEPGWYWCYNPVTHSEFICRIERSGTITENGVYENGLVCSWMIAPGKAGLSHESEWAPTTQWCGPIRSDYSQELVRISAKFKQYVHQRLSAMGVPEDPNPKRTQETGCRIGSRLDYINDTIEAVENVCDDMWTSVGNDVWSEETKRVVGDYAKRLVEALKMRAV